MVVLLRQQTRWVQQRQPCRQLIPQCVQHFGSGAHNTSVDGSRSEGAGAHAPLANFLGSDGEAHVEAHVSSAPVGGSSGTPTEETHTQETHTQELALRGLCFQSPFSRLLLSGQQTIAARGYGLGCRKIAYADEEMFLIETLPYYAHAAVLEGELAGDPPREAQVVGTITFSTSVQYKKDKGVAAWQRDRQKHRIAEGSKLDWDGKREMHAWHVACVRRFQIPVPAGENVE